MKRYGRRVASSGDSDEDWRLEVRVEHPEESPLERVLEATGRGGGAAAEDARAAVGDDVAVTHDGARIFAYADTEAAVKGARDAIDAALRAEGIEAEGVISHWEEDEWAQVDPPLTGAAAEQRRRARGAAEQVETQTFVCRAGFIVEGGIEQAMTRWAEHLGLDCQLVEHRHLLSSQLAFTVHGPRYQIEEFRRALIAEGALTFRADGFGTGLGV
jgi:hypothetical protein